MQREHKITSPDLQEQIRQLIDGFVTQYTDDIEFSQAVGFVLDMLGDEKSHVSAQRSEALARLRADGWSLNKISRQLEIDPSLISRLSK